MFFWIQHFYCATNRLVLRHRGQGPVSTGGMWAKFAIVTHVFPKEHCQDTKTLYSVSRHKVKDPCIFGPLDSGFLFSVSYAIIPGISDWVQHTNLFIYFKSSIIKPTTLNTNEQEAIGGAVADPVACVISMPPKYQHVVSSLGSEEWENYIKWQTLYHQISAF